MSNFGSREMLPVDRPRRRTNTLSLIIYSIFMILYIGIAAYAFIRGDIKKLKIQSNKIKDPQFNENINLGKQILDEIGKSIWLYIGFLAFSLLSTALCLLLVRTVSRIIIIVGFVLECITFVGMIILLIKLIVDFNATEFANNFFKTLIMAFVMYAKIYAIMRVGTLLMSEVIKESCRAVFAFPSAFLLPIITTLLVCLVFIFTVVVATYLYSINTKNQIPWYIGLFHAINMIAGFWLILTLVLFTHMVLYGTFATWFYTMDKSAIPSGTVLNSICTIFKYHWGTIAYATSICAPFVILFTMFINLRNVVRDTSHNIVIMIVCWFQIFGKLFDSAVGVSAIHGTSFKKSASTACQLYLRHPLRFLSIVQALEFCALVFVTVSGIMIAFAMAGFLMKEHMTDAQVMAAVIAICVAWFITIVPFCLILNAAVSAIAFCMFEDYERCQEDRNRVSFIKAKLKDLMVIE